MRAELIYVADFQSVQSDIGTKGISKFACDGSVCRNKPEIHDR